MFHRITALLAGVMLSTATLAGAPDAHDAHASRDSNADQAATAFDQANQRMHHDMAIRPSGNVDMDFARGMLAHHRGAVDMARIELEHGSDKQMRDLAREVIDAQQKEIEQLERWIAEHDESSTP